MGGVGGDRVSLPRAPAWSGVCGNRLRRLSLLLSTYGVPSLTCRNRQGTREVHLSNDSSAQHVLPRKSRPLGDAPDATALLRDASRPDRYRFWTHSHASPSTRRRGEKKLPLPWEANALPPPRHQLPISSETSLMLPNRQRCLFCLSVCLFRNAFQ